MARTPPKKPTAAWSATTPKRPIGPIGGLSYSVQKAPGGVWHTYPGGRRVFVRSAPPRAQSMEDAIRSSPDAMARMQGWFNNGGAQAPAAPAPQGEEDARDGQYYADTA